MEQIEYNTHPATWKLDPLQLLMYWVYLVHTRREPTTEIKPTLPFWLDKNMEKHNRTYHKEDQVKNFFLDPPGKLSKEVFETIFEGSQSFRVERIVSEGHSTPEGTWYDQAQNEWVMLLKGSAGLVFEDGDVVTVLKPGDYIDISAHRKHRVLWTDKSEKTIWLTIHYSSEQ